MRIGEHVQMLDPASRVVGDSVWLRSGARVYGVHANELINRAGALLGVRLAPLSLPLFPLPPLPAMTPGSQDIEVRQGGSLTLPPGSYRKITVRSRATLTLAGGTYHVSTLDIREQARILFRGPSRVLVKNEMDVKANCYAPNGTVWLKAKTEATGAFIGRRVRIGEKVTLDSGLP